MLGNGVIGRVRSRRELAVVRVVDEVVADGVGVNRETAGIAADESINEVTLDRLQKVFGLTGTIEDAESATKSRVRRR